MKKNKENENMRKILRTIKITGLIILSCLIITISFQYFINSQYKYALNEIATAVQDAKQISYYAARYELVEEAQENQYNPDIDYNEMKSSLKAGLDTIMTNLDQNSAANKADNSGLIRAQIKKDVNRLYNQQDILENDSDFALEVINSIDTQSTLLITYLDNVQNDMLSKLLLIQTVSYSFEFIMVITSIISLAIGIVSANRHKKDYERDKAYENYTDGLTGLLNQKYTTEVLPTEVTADGSGYLYMLDMDNFKKVNDTYGHAAGDKALITFANVLKNTTREADIPCRLGGDEFILYARAINNDKEAKQFAKRIQDNTAAAFKGTELDIVTISCGLTPVTKNTSFDMLKKRADKALYHVKEHEKGTYYLLKSRAMYAEHSNS